MLNRLMSRGAALVLLAVAAPVAAQEPISDRDLLYRRDSVGLSPQDRDRYDEIQKEDRKHLEAGQAQSGNVQPLPPLPVERNVLLGSWRVEGSGQWAGGTETMLRDMLTSLASNPGKALCVGTFGNGITFEPSSYAISALDGSIVRGSMAYRSPRENVILATPGNLKAMMSFEIAGANRIVSSDSCALVRVGAPAADSAANTPPAPGSARTAAAKSSVSPAGAATQTATTSRAREPIEPISRLGRGVQLHGEKDFQPALQQLLVAAQSDPNDPRVYVYLADTYGWLGMDAEAKQAAERAKQLDPNAFEILR